MKVYDKDRTDSERLNDILQLVRAEYDLVKDAPETPERRYILKLYTKILGVL